MQEAQAYLTPPVDGSAWCSSLFGLVAGASEAGSAARLEDGEEMVKVILGAGVSLVLLVDEDDVKVMV